MDRRSLLKLTLASAGALGLRSTLAQAESITAAQTSGSAAAQAKTKIFLNFNENSFGISPHAKKKIIETLDRSFRYPDNERAQLIENLAEKIGVEPKNISMGNGSSENIQALIQALHHRAIKKQKNLLLVVPDPTFNYAQLYADASGVEVVKIPLQPETLAFDIAAMQKAAADFSGDVAFYICNPNNPTAGITSGKSLQEWVKSAPDNHFFIIDEAYAEFVTDSSFSSAIDYVKAGAKNVAVTRTFSKFYALAGLRVGYAISSAENISEIERFMSIDNSNLTAMVAARASLQDMDFQQHSLASHQQARKIIMTALDELKLDYVEPHANFVFHKVNGDVKTYQTRMAEHNIVVGREFPPLNGWNRLTIGTPAEMTVFVETLKLFREKEWV